MMNKKTLEETIKAIQARNRATAKAYLVRQELEALQAELQGATCERCESNARPGSVLCAVCYFDDCHSGVDAS